MKKQKRMKTVLTLVTLAVVLLVVVPVALALPFNDVPAGYWAFAAIDRISNLHITVGCGGGNFCPEQNVTRAQMAGFINNLTKAWNNTNEPYIFSVDNQDDGTGSSGDGIVARSYGQNGLEGISYGAAYADNGVYGETNSTSTGDAAVYANSTGAATGVYAKSASGTGGYFQGAAGQPDVVLGGGVDDDGNLWSDPGQAGSDIWIYSNDAVIIDLDDDGGEGGQFEIRNEANDTLLNVDEISGDVSMANDLYLDSNGSGNGGVYATAAAGPSQNLVLVGNDDVAVHLDENNDEAGSCFTIYNGANGTVASWCEAKNTAAGVQAMAVDTSAGAREMYATGATEVWFEDFGTANLVDGQATVAIDPLFAEAVNLAAEYHVYLTALSDQPVLLYVTAKTPASFEVRGATLDGQPAAAGFEYRIVAKRAGYEDWRLQAADTAGGTEPGGDWAESPAVPGPGEDAPVPVHPLIQIGEEVRPQ